MPDLEVTNSQLMRRYCASGDADAFRELVTRHLPLVLGAAMRRSGGDRALAEDIAQQVFTDFARRMSKLRPDERIGAWLYRAAFLKAGDVMKAERRRKRREQLAATMQEIDRLPDAEGWRALSPVIDEAMQHLNERDREVLVLRFFEGKKLDAVAEAIGTKTATVQKRVERALERLRAKLKRAGVTGSAPALAGLIATQSRAEASATTVERIASRAAVTTGGLTVASLLSLPLIAVGMLLGLGIGNLPLLGERSAPPVDSPNTATPSVSRPAPRPLSAIPKNSDGSLEEIVAALGEVFSRPLNSLDRIRADELLGRISQTQAGEALSLMERHWTPAMLGRIDVEDRRTGLFSQWATQEPKEALEWLLAMLRPGSGAHYRQPQLWGMAFHGGFTRWAYRNRADAWAWTQAQLDGAGFESDRQADLSTALSQMFGPSLIEQLGKVEGTEALLELQALTANPRFGVAMGPVLKYFDTNEDVIELLDLIERRIARPEKRVTATEQTLFAWAARDWQAAMDWVAAMESEARRSRYAWAIAFLRDMDGFDVGEHVRWLGEIAPDPNRSIRSQTTLSLMDSWFARDPEPAADWLMAHPDWLDASVAYNVLRQLNTFATDAEKSAPDAWREQALRLVLEVARRTKRDPQSFTRTPISGSFANDQETRDRMRQFLDEVAEEGSKP